MPDVQINNSDGPVTVNAGSNVDVSIALEANLQAGVGGQEFLVAFRQSGPNLWFSPPSAWIPSAAPIPFRIGLLASSPATSVFSTTGVPPGSYKVTYAAVTGAGLAEAIVDSVVLTVQ